MANEFGWRNAFYLVALPGFLMALVIGLWVREPEQVQGRQKPTMADARRLLLDPNMVVCILLSILLVAYFVIWSYFTPLYLTQNKGIAPTDMGYIMSSMGIASIAIAFIVPGLSDLLGRKPVAIVAGILGAVMPLGTLLIDSTSLVPYYAVFAIGAAVTGVFPMAMATIPSEIVPVGLTATALSMTMGISEIIGGVFGPPAAGWMGDVFGLGAAMWILAGVSIGVGVVALFLRETAPMVLARRAQRA
jgi:predicted MFS family arabinose efflux permease